MSSSRKKKKERRKRLALQTQSETVRQTEADAAEQQSVSVPPKERRPVKGDGRRGHQPPRPGGGRAA